MKRVLIFLIRTYKLLVSPLIETVFGKGCVFTPTCSEYAIDSIKRYGMGRGTALFAKRIVKCHPGAHATFDPVPEK